MIKTYIYGLVDPRTNKICYVGKSDNPDYRLKAHIKETSRSKTNYRLHNLLRLLAKENLSVNLTIIEECNVENWKEREIFWIKYYRDNGYDLTNMTDGGDGVVGYEFTEEDIKKSSDSHKGQITWMKGKHHKEESKEILKIKALKQWENKEARKLKSEQTREQFNVEGFRENHSKAKKEWHKTNKHPMEGKHQTEEAKRKIGLANEGREQSEENKEKARERMLGNKYRLGKIPWNKGKKLHKDSEETKNKKKLAQQLRRSLERKENK